MYFRADTKTLERTADVVIFDTGKVWWLQQHKYQSACLIDVTDYPYDQQKCDLWFQSLSNPSAKLDLQPYYKPLRSTSFDLDTYLSGFKRADEWEIIRNYSKRVPKPIEEGEKLMFSKKVTLRFTLMMRRRVGFYAYLLSIPCVVLGCMSILVFVLPPERPDRHAIGLLYI